MSQGIIVRQSLVSDMITGCPRRVYLTYIELNYRKPNIALFTGSIYHETFEYYFKQKINGVMLSLNDLVDYYSDLWNKKFDKNTDMGRVTQSQAKMICMSLITIFYSWAKDYDIETSEEECFIEFNNGDRIVTHLDIKLKSGIIIDMKSARTNIGRNGEYFPDYSERSVQYKPQPMIHMLAMPGYKYEFNVVGKGEHKLIERFPVRHSQAKLDLFKENTLVPILQQLHDGDFPAVPSPLCGVCEWAHNIKKCGLGI